MFLKFVLFAHCNLSFPNETDKRHRKIFNGFCNNSELLIKFDFGMFIFAINLFIIIGNF